MAELRTRLTGLLGIDLPVIQAPIGNQASPKLAAAVSNAGGLGMLALGGVAVDGIPDLVARTRALTDRPFAANLPLVDDKIRHLEALLAAGVRLISLAWGDPAAYIPLARAAGAKVLVTVASAAEARAAAELGADAIVAQGAEAGGHVMGTVGTFVLVPAVVAAVPNLPVVAAGGIADGRGLAAAITLGADGAWIGTRFIASVEAGSHAGYKDRVVAAAETDTFHGVVFDGGWPDTPHRALRNRTVDEWVAAGRPPAGQRPGEGEVIAHTPDGAPVKRYDDMPPQDGMGGDWEDCALYAGQSAGLVTGIAPAAKIVEAIADEAAAILGMR